MPLRWPGRIDIDLKKDAIGRSKDGKAVFLADLWPTQKEVEEAVEQISSDMFRKSYSEVYDGDETLEFVGGARR